MSSREARIRPADREKFILERRKRRLRRQDTWTSPWKESGFPADVPDEPTTLAEDLEKDAELAAKLSRRRAEAKEGNLVWPSEEEIKRRSGNLD